MQAAFLAAQAQDTGGAQLCVYRHGERVVDLWAGWDPANERPYGADGIGVLMSCTKGVVVAGAHMLADRGLIDFDAPMASYWPEFAQAGKGAVTVRQCLSHTGGLMAYDAEASLPPAISSTRTAPPARWPRWRRCGRRARRRCTTSSPSACWPAS